MTKSKTKIDYKKQLEILINKIEERIEELSRKGVSYNLETHKNTDYYNRKRDNFKYP